MAEVTEAKLEKEFGKKATSYVMSHEDIHNQWALYNMLTYYISNVIEKRLQASYQLRVSKMFDL
jgi:hypothetical protein